MTTTNQKLKLLHLLRILETETDDNHGLTGPQIIEKLQECGVQIERKTLYRDLQCLQEFGYDIQKYQRCPVEYGLASRNFQEQELLLMADAVQSSKFLTQRKAKSLVKEIGKLGSKYIADELHRHLHVEGRIKSQNESVYYNVDAIQRAMRHGRKVEFKYFKLDENKRRVMQHNNHVYVETPVQLAYMNDAYYLVVWNDKHGGFTNYRVDRMLNITVSEAPATKNQQIAEFDMASYQQRSFDMFSGNASPVTLLVNANVMSAVVDRLGADVATTPAGAGTARVHATVMESPTFFGWLATFGTDIVIEAPQSMRAAYVEYLANIAQAYSC